MFAFFLGAAGASTFLEDQADAGYQAGGKWFATRYPRNPQGIAGCLKVIYDISGNDVYVLDFEDRP